MRVVPLEKKPSRARFVVLGVFWVLAGTAALTYMARRPPTEFDGSAGGGTQGMAHVR